MRSYEWVTDRFETAFGPLEQRKTERDQGFDALGLFPSETAVSEESSGPASRRPEQTHDDVLFERRPVAWHSPPVPPAERPVTEDKVPTYLLNGLVTAVIVACAAYMGAAPLRVLLTTIPVEGLPLSRAAVLQKPAPPPIVRAPHVSRPDLAVAPARHETPAAARAVTEAEPRNSTGPLVGTLGPRGRHGSSTGSAAELARIRAVATERAAIAAEGVTRSFAGTPGSSAGMPPANPQQPAAQPAP